ncbi:MAG: EAL domain-containing protein [Proteobacteria bacterium]|nr:EAL domain-containing protein [Pseudomonadota bacterium]
MQSLIERAVDQASDAMFVIELLDNGQTNVAWINAEFSRLTGFAVKALTNHAVGHTLAFQGIAQADADFISKVVSGDTLTLLVGNHTKEGAYYRCFIRLTPVFQEEVPSGILGVVREFNEYDELTEELKYLALHDDLTGLPNRKLFRDRLSQAVERAKRYSENIGLLLLDLDGFKGINDSFGHPFGDSVLKEVGQRLAKCVRSSDTVCRLAGDEFTILLPTLFDANDALLVARKVLGNITSPMDIEGQTVLTSPSIGIAVFPRDAHDATTLISRADNAMYRAKALGKGQIKTYDPSMALDDREQLSLRRDLTKAVNEESFHLHFQPIVDENRKLVGGEAFLRWYHPERGAVSPGKLLPALEGLNRDVEVGYQVLDAACLYGATWAQDIRIVVNLSPRQLEHADLTSRVMASLGRRKLAPQRLELDITGSRVLDKPEVTKRLQELRELGIRVAIDDFGTNELSLAKLRDLKVDIVKLDASFVKDIGHESQDLVRTLIALGHTMGVQVLAKGVETVAQQQYLSTLKCDFMQGWLFSSPVPPEDFRELLARGLPS